MDIGRQETTLGDLFRKNPGLLPPPLESAVETIRDYASDEADICERVARQVEKVELIVVLASIVATYLPKESK